MQKAYRAILAVAGRVLFIGFSIQIVLGICWMAGNFTGFQNFGESNLYEEISKTLICDEYEGVLYPVLLLLARGIEGLLFIPYHCILYLVQILVAGVAGYKLLRNVGVMGRVQLVWGTLAMLTFPFAMQCHLAVLPDSLTSSFFLLEISGAVKMLRNGQLQAEPFVRVLLCWLLTALLRPEYFLLGIVPVIVLLGYSILGERKLFTRRILYQVILIAAFAGMITGVETLSQVDGYYGRSSQSLNAALVSRFEWPYFSTDYLSWPEEVREHIDWNHAKETDYYADRVDTLFCRALEDAVGKEHGKELMGEVASVAWQLHKRDILKDIMWDAVGYTFSPMVVQWQFQGRAYDSYTGRNYDIMGERTPLLTGYYVDYSCWWFAVGLVTAILMLLAECMNGLGSKQDITSRKAAKSKIVAAAGICFAAMGSVVIYYTMRGAGMMDYKKSIAVSLLWVFGVVLTSSRTFGSGEESHG